MATAPDFLCIGAQKAGTSWLYAMLRQHPSVFFPPMKEVHFYDFLYLPEHRRWIRASFEKHSRRHSAQVGMRSYFERLSSLPRHQDVWYAAVFEHPDAISRVTGEITPAYSILPAEGVAHVRATNPAMKIILVVRDPVDRALSQLRMTAERRGWPTVGLSRANEAGVLSAVLARSAFRENIARWEAEFPSEQIQFLPYGCVRSAPTALLRRVEAFLGLSPYDYTNVTDLIHKTRAIEVEPECVTMLEQRLQGEREWLLSRFGEAFLL